MLVTIDYLIMNFKGDLTLNFDVTASKYAVNSNCPFELNQEDFGTKIFKNAYTLYHEGKLIGKILSNPRSPVIDEKLIQFQLENYLFYTVSNEGLKNLIIAFQEYYKVKFDSFNRLDIAFDSNDSDLYNDLFNKLDNEMIKLKGRDKTINVHNHTINGVLVPTGYSIGKRSSSKFLRIYNKSYENACSREPKKYIDDFHELNQLNGVVWRFEFQLNNKFFTNLATPIGLEIFDDLALVNLLEFAEKNFFEFVYNTNKSQNQKEKDYNFRNWDKVKEFYRNGKGLVLARLKKIFEISDNVNKRLVKSLFRQFYQNKNSIYFKTLIKVFNNNKLSDWFVSKYKYYLREFEFKEKIKNTFNLTKFENQLYSCIGYSADKMIEDLPLKIQDNSINHVQFNDLKYVF
nr:replication initiation factor domain-containing protein [uncultured Flavobacterium sp.]